MMSQYFSNDRQIHQATVKGLVLEKLSSVQLRTILSDPTHSCREFTFLNDWGFGRTVVTAETYFRTVTVVDNYPDKLVLYLKPSELRVG